MRIRNVDAYIDSIGRMDEIRKYCDDNNIDDYATLYEVVQKEKPEWKRTITGRGAIKALDRYFYRKQVEITHKEVMKDVPHHTGVARPVICTDNDMEFKSINAAAKWVGIQHSQMIGDCCRGVIDNVRGYHFKFKEEETVSNINQGRDDND